MPKITNYVGMSVGVWNVLSKTDKRDEIGIIYLCEHKKTKQRAMKTSNYLSQVIKYKCKSTKIGRPRKWLITKVPYVEKRGDELTSAN